MEPMTLGSPTHSPSSSPNVGYLPPFLLGEVNAPSTPRTNSLSPTKARTLAFGTYYYFVMLIITFINFLIS